MANGVAPETEQRRSVVIDFDGTITEADLLDEIARSSATRPSTRRSRTGSTPARFRSAR